MLKMSTTYDFSRFLEVHEEEYEDILWEIQHGQVKDNIICYFFPQLKGLDTDCINNYYSINGLAEAEEYLQNNTLKEHLEELCTEILNYYDLSEIFQKPDIRRIHASVTLFLDADSENEILEEVLDRFFDGEQCARTQEHLNDEMLAEIEMAGT